jgi:hypothetical protein
MLPKTEKVPEYLRRSLRLGLGVTLPCLVGFGVIGPEHVAYSDAAKNACKWAGITAAIVAQPLIGQASKVGGERLLGTLLGGTIGLLLHQIGMRLFGEAMDGIFMSVSAGILAASSILIGEKKFKLNTSAKLFVVTLLLITFAGDSGHDLVGFTSARVLGISIGVSLMLLLSVAVYPKSATVEALHNMDDALQSLILLNVCAWRHYMAPRSGIENGVPHNQLHHCLEENLLEDRLLDPHDEVQRRDMETALTKLYESLFDMEDNLKASMSETLIKKTKRNSLILVPRLLPRVSSSASNLPEQELHAMANSVRRVARGLFMIEKTLEDWDDVITDNELTESSQAHDKSLASIAESMRHVLLEIQDAFPMKPSLDGTVLLEMIRNIHAWSYEMRGVHEAWDKKYQEYSTKLRHMERRTSSLLLRDSASFDHNELIDEAVDLESGEEMTCTIDEARAEWSTLTFAITSLAADIGDLWNACELVLEVLPYQTM